MDIVFDRDSDGDIEIIDYKVSISVINFKTESDST